MRSPKLVRRGRAALVVVDIQEKLAASMDGERLEGVLGNTVRIIETAKELGVPVIITEQYPKGLGKTLDVVREAASGAAVVEKLAFSALGEEETYNRLKDARARDVILVGMEAHVCVSQTAYDLDAAGFRPVVLVDAVISRFEGDGEAAIARLRGDGITVTTTEAVIFELLERAGTEVFSRVRKLVRRKQI